MTRANFPPDESPAAARPGEKTPTRCGRCHRFTCVCADHTTPPETYRATIRPGESFTFALGEPATLPTPKPTWTKVPDRHPPPHARYLVRREGVLHTATPCYGMHPPFWVVKTMVGEAEPVLMLPEDEWLPAATSLAPAAPPAPAADPADDRCQACQADPGRMPACRPCEGTGRQSIADGPVAVTKRADPADGADAEQGPDMDEMHADGVNRRWCQCSTCGYVWERFRDGSHSCSKKLLDRLAAAEARVLALLAERDKLAARVREVAGDGWRPIETAPRDETPVLLWAPKCTAVVGPWWALLSYVPPDQENRWNPHVELVDPTHWQPLPPPPGAAGPTGGQP